MKELAVILAFLSLPAFSPQYTPEDIRNRHTAAYPVSRLNRDWIYQDHGLKCDDCFVSAEHNEVERAMVGRRGPWLPPLATGGKT